MPCQTRLTRCKNQSILVFHCPLYESIIAARKLFAASCSGLSSARHVLQYSMSLTSWSSGRSQCIIKLSRVRNSVPFRLMVMYASKQIYRKLKRMERKMYLMKQCFSILIWFNNYLAGTGNDYNQYRGGLIVHTCSLTWLCFVVWPTPIFVFISQKWQKLDSSNYTDSAWTNLLNMKFNSFIS